MLCFSSSGIELMNSTALLLLLLVNLLLVGRQERLKRSEMVRRLRSIIAQLDGEFGTVGTVSRRLVRFKIEKPRVRLIYCPFFDFLLT